MRLGIDIGGTNISLGLLQDNELVKSMQIPSFQREWSLQQTLQYLSDRIKPLLSPEVESIGIGVPSVVDVEKGIVYDTANIPSWTVVPLKETLEKELGITVKVNNDANCYAMGAYSVRPFSQRPESLVAMTLGTGMGMGIVLDGKIYAGTHCGAGELGCLPFKDATLEDYCCKGFFTSRGLTPKKAYEAALHGDSEAVAMFVEFGRNLGQAVCTALLAYDPAVIVIGGGIAKGSVFFKKAMEDYISGTFPYHKTVQDLCVEFLTDDNLPVIGAASL